MCVLPNLSGAEPTTTASTLSLLVEPFGRPLPFLPSSIGVATTTGVVTASTLSLLVEPFGRPLPLLPSSIGATTATGVATTATFGCGSPIAANRDPDRPSRRNQAKSLVASPARMLCIIALQGYETRHSVAFLDAMTTWRRGGPAWHGSLQQDFWLYATRLAHC